MNSYTVNSASGVRGEIRVPGDKSISHRSIMFGSIASGVTRVTGFLRGEDALATLEAFRAMGVEVEDDGETLTIHGKGLRGLSEPTDLLDCGNSGTSMRLLTGLLAGQNFFSVLSGDKYLRARPMKRVVTPLALMGARILGRAGGEKAPLAIQGCQLKGIEYDSPISSAQVKSAILLAGLYAEGDTVVREPHLSRDHSERMLRHFGARVESFPGGVRLSGGAQLSGRDIAVPGDISSAAFFMVAALIVPGSELIIRGVGVNPTRTGVIDILKGMGGDLELLNPREESGEPVADLRVRSSKLKAMRICGELVPRAIDEFPAICVAAALAEGVTVIGDASELRVKETDRIAAMAANLRLAGVEVAETPDGMEITGQGSLKAAAFDSFGDHRIAMSMTVAALTAPGQSSVSDVDCIATSFPGFRELLAGVVVS